MNATNSTERTELWSRPLPKRKDGPNRKPGGFYRTSDGAGSALGGVPLVAAEDAVVAAVRMAYKVAEAQVDRSTRLAQRLRDAGDRAVGPHSDRQALDATERLVFRAMMGGLTWLEGATAERESPLKRLMAAEYRLLASMLGLAPAESPRPSRRKATKPASRKAGLAAAAEEDPEESSTRLPLVKIVHTGEDKRPIRIRRFEVARGYPLDAPVLFYSVESIASAPLEARLEMGARGPATLTLTTPRRAPAGRWRGAVCNDKRGQGGLIEHEQVGFIEIVL